MREAKMSPAITPPSEDGIREVGATLYYVTVISRQWARLNMPNGAQHHVSSVENILRLDG